MILFYVLAGLIAAIVLSGWIFFRLSSQLGAQGNIPIPKDADNLSYFRDGLFFNPVPTKLTPPNPSILYKFLFANNGREPKDSIPNIQFSRKQYDNQNDEPVITWFGHSSILLQLNAQNILIDPVFSARASMFPFMGPKAFKMDYKTNLADLPHIDILLLSHDHYDHLDYEVIKKIAPQVKRIYTTYGVGHHLLKWGIDSNKIKQLLWWQQEEIGSDIQLTSVPMRHFSGRALNDRYTTLWGGFAIKSSTHNILFSADSGYFDGFKEIGKKLGPFDLAFMECGQYNEAWQSIHMMPEETVQASKDVGAKQVIPIHWGKFPLSLHPWQEPIERFVVASKDKSFATKLPEIGGTYKLSDLPDKHWWEGLK